MKTAPLAVLLVVAATALPAAAHRHSACLPADAARAVTAGTTTGAANPRLRPGELARGARTQRPVRRASRSSERDGGLAARDRAILMRAGDNAGDRPPPRSRAAPILL